MTAKKEPLTCDDATSLGNSDECDRFDRASVGDSTS